MSSSMQSVTTDSVASDLSNVFRTDSWINSWRTSWSDYLQRYNFSADEYFYYVFLPVWKCNLITAVPVGCSSLSLQSIRSEYFDLQIELADWFSRLSQNWQQLIIPDVDVASSTYSRINQVACERGYFIYQRSVSPSYGVIASETEFSDYLSRLSQSARARLFNKRKKLEQLGSLAITNIWPDLGRFIDLLNGFHQERWGKPCYQNENLDFIKRFLGSIVEQGAKVNLSVMTLDEQPISLLLDVEYFGRVYNFQAGFVEKLSNNIAVGSLHLGYAIEAAFSDPAVKYYDFMAGQGKNTDYKAAFANSQQQLATLYVIRPAWLYWLYKINDRIRSWSRNMFNQQGANDPR